MANEEEQDGGRQDWLGFSCPECHTLFRVPADHIGKRVECPACRSVVAIPAEAEVEVEVEVEVERPGGEVAAERSESSPSPGEREGRKKVRKKKEKKKKKAFSWERARAKSSRAPLVNRRVLLVAGAAFVILLAGVSVLVLKGRRGAETGTNPADDGGSGPPYYNPPFGHPQLPDPVQEEISKVEMGVVLREIEIVVEEFLKAPAVEELLALARGDEALKGRIREYYRSREHTPLVPRDLAPNGRIMKSGELWAIDVVLPDFSVRPIAVERLGPGYKVDWESWVGYSEMPWERFLETRPVTPVLFRVLCSEVDYYNFDFSDEQEWRSYRLESPDRKQVLYGYVPRHSILESKLAPAKRGKEDGYAFVLRLRYPENAQVANQVLIDEVVESGWVVGGKRARSRQIKFQ